MRALIFAALVLAFAPACGDDGETKKDAGVSDAGAPDASCFTDPMTHEEIINACTTAQKIYKTPTLPLLEHDGSLPPLPQ